MWKLLFILFSLSAYSAASIDEDLNSDLVIDFIDCDREESNYERREHYNPKKCTLEPPPTPEELAKVDRFVQKFNKRYRQKNETICRTIHTVYNMRVNKEHNERYERGEVTYKRGKWAGSDLTLDELRAKYAMKNLHIVHDPENHPRATLPVLPPARNFVNYTAEGLVGAVEGQYGCGCCYAFAAMGSLEGQLRKCKISNATLSVQSIVDCATTGCWGCQSGWPYWSFKWMMKTGIMTDDDYPYAALKDTCAFDKKNIIATVSAATQYNFTDVYGNATFIKQLVSKVGPIAAVLCLHPDIYHHRSGVFKVDKPCNTIDHAVTIVGYGTDPVGGDYWLIKNSWGPTWAEGGFAKIARGSNMCLIELIVAHPTVKRLNGTVCP